MAELPPLDWQTILYLFLALMTLGLALSLIMLVWVVRRVKRIQLPANADALTALRSTPISIVILLDLLDLTLDFLSAPFSWVLLGYLGLQPLRAVTTVEAFIPGTQFLPTMTAAWIVARLTDPNRNRN